MNSQILVCLSFIVFFDITISEDYIKQVPWSINRNNGQSASTECSVQENIDIRELGLNKRLSQILTLRINSGTLSKTLNVSGTYDNFTWILNQEGGGTFPCTTDSVGSGIACHSQDDKIYLSNGGENMASLSVNSSLDYRSRIQLSGNIRNLTITLTGLSESDRNCYTCSGKAETIQGVFKGNYTCLIVAKGTGRKLSPGAIAVILIGAVFIIAA